MPPNDTSFFLPPCARPQLPKCCSGQCFYIYIHIYGLINQEMITTTYKEHRAKVGAPSKALMSFKSVRPGHSGAEYYRKTWWTFTFYKYPGDRKKGTGIGVHAFNPRTLFLWCLNSLCKTKDLDNSNVDEMNLFLLPAEGWAALELTSIVGVEWRC